jgi:hypothetical protein
MTITPLSPSRHPGRAAISPASATLRRQRPPAPPSVGKTWSTEDQITAPIASRAAQTSTPLVTQPSPCPQLTIQIKQRRQIRHRSTPAPVRTPSAVSSLEAFRTPASVRLLTPASGRRPKTLNDSRRSISPETAKTHPITGSRAYSITSRRSTRAAATAQFADSVEEVGFARWLRHSRWPRMALTRGWPPHIAAGLNGDQQHFLRFWAVAASGIRRGRRSARVIRPVELEDAFGGRTAFRPLRWQREVW